MPRLKSRPANVTAALPSDALFAGPGEMRARCRALDWAATPLGPSAAWPPALRATIAMLLASRHPMFLWWGPELTQVYNDAYRPSLGEGLRQSTALGMQGEQCWTEIWNVIGPQIAQVLAGGESTWHEDQLVPIERNGALEDVWWTYSFGPAFNDVGAVGGVLVVCHETTHQVRATADRERLILAEQRARRETDAARENLARIFAQAPVAVAVMHGRELRYAVANPKYQAIIGNRDPIGRTLVEMFPELEHSDILGVLQRVYDDGIPFVATDLLIRFDSAGDGSIDNFYDLVYHPLTASDGAVTGIVVVAVDVTDRRRIILDAIQARADAEVANRAKSEFLAVMSHELRTPLNAIGGYADLIDMGIHGPVTADQRTDLERIKTSQKHLLALVSGVLDYARLERGYVAFRGREVWLGDVVSTCEALVTPQARARGISIEFTQCTPDHSAYVDVDKLHQVVLNLLANAVKFTEAGGSITMRCEVTSSVASVHVTDTGRGIPLDQCERIFEPFVQVDAGLTREQDGIGLGLAICRDLARRMHGDLRVESEVGVGSTFTLTLPRFA